MGENVVLLSMCRPTHENGNRRRAGYRRHRSSAVVGASDEEGSVGHAITANLQGEFDGEVVPANPNPETVFGLHGADGLAEANAVDLAVVPLPVVLDVLREAGEASVGDVVVITAGFAEADEPRAPVGESRRSLDHTLSTTCWRAIRRRSRTRCAGE